MADDPPEDDGAPPPPEPPDLPPAPVGRRGNLHVVRNARRLPADVDVERSLLGACMFSADAVQTAVDANVTAAQFAIPSHGHVWHAIATLQAEGVSIDARTVWDQLGRQQLQHGIQAADLVSWVAGATARSVARYCEIIARHHQARRQMLDLEQALDALAGGDPAGAAVHIDSARDHVELTAAGSSWEPINLAEIMAGSVLDPPTMLLRSDGQHLLYPGKVHAFNAEAESGKTMVALQACAEQIWQGSHVVYIDFEDGPKGIVERLLSMEVDSADIVARFHYLRPDDPLDLAAFAHLAHLLEEHTPTLVIVDGVTEAMTLNGWSLLDNEDIARFYAALPKRIARTGAAVVLIDHVPKKRDDRGKGGIGGQHKRAGIDGVSYTLEVIRPFARGLDGEIRLTVDKDRGGYIRAAATGGEWAATIRIMSTEGPLGVHIDVPSRTADAGEWHGPTQCMDALRSWFAEHPDERLSKTQARVRFKSLGLSYRGQTIDEALERLALAGELHVAPGPRNARIFFHPSDQGTLDAIDF